MIEKKNILIVDNTTSFVSPWKTDIKRYFNLVEVIGGFEALTKLKSNNIIATIVNLSLRSFNGMDVVIKIREKYKSLPIIVIAEKTDMHYVKSVTSYGIHGYFLSPIDSGQLIMMLTKISGISIAQFENELAVERVEIEQKKTRADQNGEGMSGEDIPALYYQGQSCLLQGNIDGAIDIFNKIATTKKMKDTWRRYVEDSLFQMGRCYIKKNEFKEAIEKFNQFIAKAPNSELNKQALFLIGECFEKMNDMTKAIMFFKKVVSMPPMDSITSQARKRLSSLEKR